MAYNARVKFVWFGIAAVAAVALIGCDNGTGDSGGGTGASSATGSPASSSGSPAGSTGSGSTGSGSPGGAITCAGSYCTYGDGGYPFAYADGEGPMITGTSTATLATDGSLCITGQTMALPAMPTQMDYSNDWGAGIGVNLNQPMGMMTTAGSYKFTGTGVTVNTTTPPACLAAADIRVVLDQDGTNQVCAQLTPGTEITWADFNTECWAGGMGTPLSGPPSTESLKVQFVTTSSPCSFSNFCLTQIVAM